MTAEEVEQTLQRVSVAIEHLTQLATIHEERLDGQDEADVQTESRLDALIDSQITLTRHVDALTEKISTLATHMDALMVAQAKTDEQIRLMVERNGSN